MKRLLLVASLCLAAVIVAPIASANAETVGRCEMKGEAKFYSDERLEHKTHLSPVIPQPLWYKFNSESGKCEGRPPTTFESWEAKGEAQLSCVVYDGLELTGRGRGESFIRLSAKVDNSSFQFVGAGATLVFETKGEATGTGVMSFAENTNLANECLEERADELKFVAVETGNFK